MGMREARGFTLIELLVVIAIIGLLASVVLSAVGVARAKGRDAKRLGDLRELRTALALYANEHSGKYPSTTDWYGACPITAGWGTGSKGTSGTSGWIPDLAPTYIPVLPTDPNPSTNLCYLYKSNGTDYMILAYGTVESYTSATNLEPRPQQNGVVNPCNPSGVYTNTFAVYTQGAECW